MVGRGLKESRGGLELLGWPKRHTGCEDMEFIRRRMENVPGEGRVGFCRVGGAGGTLAYVTAQLPNSDN